MTTVTIEEAQAKLPELIDHLAEGEELVITRNQRLIGEQPMPRLRPAPGLGKGILTIISDDDEHLQDFADYMS